MEWISDFPILVFSGVPRKLCGGCSKMWFNYVCLLVIFAMLSCFYIMLSRRNISSRERIILFSRFPAAGRSKTRLIGVLGEAGAADAQLHMTEHILNVLSEFLLQRANATVEAKLSGGTRKQLNYWLGRKRFPRQRFCWSQQCDGHLGVRMADALDCAFKAGSEVAVIIGSDIPGISVDILESALLKLSSPDCQMVLGPAKDGGYYLVGLRKEVKHKLGALDDLFEGIEWSTSTVCQQQLQVATELGTRVELMPQVLQDVDIPDDLVEFERQLGISVDDLKSPILSIVIPTLNEERNIEGTLQSVKENCSWPSYVTVIVSDGGSTDGTLKRVEEFAERNPEVRIKTVQGRRGRGQQLNAGAQEATGINLLFLHADTKLPRAFDRHVLLTLAEPGNVAGAFNLGWDVLRGNESEKKGCGWWVKTQLRLVTFMHRTSHKLTETAPYLFSETAYGDQAMFMSRKTFEEVGRFSPICVMEDYEMAKKLQRVGHLRIVPDVFVITSARRVIRKGILKVTLINLLMVMGYNIGIHPDRLGRFYYG